MQVHNLLNSIQIRHRLSMVLLQVSCDVTCQLLLVSLEDGI